MQEKLLSAVLAATSAVCVWAPSASATGVLDQQQPLTNGTQQVVNDQSLAQTITAGITGGMDQVDLMLGCSPACPPTAPLTVEIRNASAGFPGATVLAATSLPASAVTSSPAFVPITFATPEPVTAGAQDADHPYNPAPPNHFD